MRIHLQRRGLVPALVVAVLGTVLLYVGATRGVTAWTQSRHTPVAGAGVLPDIVVNAPPTVPTTRAYGPIGGIALVFAGTEVDDGLLGTVDQPWIAVASHGGDYRAIDAPDLPGRGSESLAVSHDGDLLAWAGGEGVVVYDAVTGDSTQLPADGIEQVGAFSPDTATVVAAGTDGLSIIDLDDGAVLGSAPAAAGVLSRAAWRPDSSAVDFVSGTELTTVTVEDEVSTQPTEIPEDASLAWSPNGDRLVSLREADGVNRLFLSTLTGDGEIGAGQRVLTEGISLERLIGFSGERTVAVTAYLLESGSVERVLDIPLDGRSPSDLTSLPPPGNNWVDSGTLTIAADNLVAGSTSYGDQTWPWSYAARLVGCALTAFFLFGLYVTRRKRGR